MHFQIRLSKLGVMGVLLGGMALMPFGCDAQTQDSPGATDSTASPAAGEGGAVAAQDESGQKVSTSDASAPYSVDCSETNDAGEPVCVVDNDTFVGWRTYHAFCHVCHAQDAVGSTFAPNLLSRMLEPDMDLELFVDRVDNGYTGQVGVMPPWKDNPNVSKRYRELYAYLMARASGDLLPGRPKKQPKPE